MAYDAGDIKILKEGEADERFLWKKAEILSGKYNVPISCVQRGLEASERLGIPDDYYVNRYLKKLETELMPEFTEVYEDILSGK